MTDINIQNLIVNKLTVDQFKTAKANNQIDENAELYLITDIVDKVDALELNSYTKAQVDVAIATAIQEAFANIARAENTAF